MFILSFLFTVVMNAQVAKNSELHQTLKKHDSLLFNSAFNLCKLSDLNSIIDNELEFYHDQSGISNGKDYFLKTIKQNICSSPKSKPIRKLIEQSLEVYPMYTNGVLYGAIQKGKHNFFLKENDKLKPTVTADFTHLWVLKDKKWKLTRVLSYNHLPIQH